jgi:hypothetical protein
VIIALAGLAPHSAFKCREVGVRVHSLALHAYAQHRPSPKRASRIRTRLLRIPPWTLLPPGSRRFLPRRMILGGRGHFSLPTQPACRLSDGLDWSWRATSLGRVAPNTRTNRDTNVGTVTQSHAPQLLARQPRASSPPSPASPAPAAPQLGPPARAHGKNQFCMQKGHLSVSPS